jgi:hypothetical protein
MSRSQLPDPVHPGLPQLIEQGLDLLIPQNEGYCLLLGERLESEMSLSPTCGSDISPSPACKKWSVWQRVISELLHRSCDSPVLPGCLNDVNKGETSCAFAKRNILSLRSSS